MNVDGHRKKAGEIESSLKELLPDSEGRHVVAVVELTFGILLHWIAFGMEKKFGKHMDTHVGLPRELRRVGERKVAEVFETIDTFRAGRWYGSKSNGDVVEKCIESIETIKEWAQE
jgi:hypothetical protein